MKEEHREWIANNIKLGEQKAFWHNNKPFEWTIGKLLSAGITSTGFPFIVWETTNFGSILVGNSIINGLPPQSKLRNDTNGTVILNSLNDRMYTATKMARELIHRA